MTIFQKIIDKQVPADIVHEDEKCLAFRDIHPQAPLHVLVIPKKAIAKVADMKAEDEAIVGHLLRVASEIAAREKVQDFRLVVNNGAGAGQSVFHLHVHLLGGRPLAWPPG